MKAYNAAIQRDPENATTFHGKGKALHKLYLYEDALSSYEEALRLSPYLAEAYRDKATVLEILAAQARQKADEMENQPLSSDIFPQPMEKDGSFIRLGTMISNGKLQIGERVYVSKHPNQMAKIIDGRTVEFQGRHVSINEWARKIAGWPSINIYSHVYLERTKQPLGNLRE